MTLEFKDPEDRAHLTQQVLKGLQKPINDFNDLLEAAHTLGINLQLVACTDNVGKQWLQVEVGRQ